MPSLMLPEAGGALRRFTLSRPTEFAKQTRVAFDRVAYSAAHVVADPLAAADPWIDCAIDWDATIAHRRRLWSLGLGVAEAMDTAQRGMGLDWRTSLELIRRCLEQGAGVASGSLYIGTGLAFAPEYQLKHGCSFLLPIGSRSLPPANEKRMTVRSLATYLRTLNRNSVTLAKESPSSALTNLQNLEKCPGQQQHLWEYFAILM